MTEYAYPKLERVTFPAKPIATAPTDRVILVRFACPNWHFDGTTKVDDPPYHYWTMASWTDEDCDDAIDGRGFTAAGWYDDGTDELIEDPATHWVELPEVE